MNAITWNIDRAIEHLRGAYEKSKDPDDPVRHADLRDVLEAVNMTLGAVRQSLDEEKKG